MTWPEVDIGYQFVGGDGAVWTVVEKGHKRGYWRAVTDDGRSEWMTVLERTTPATYEDTLRARAEG